MSEQPFWETKSLKEMSSEEWESLCDGCAKCCLIKLKDVDTDEVYTTDVACKLLDCTNGRCSNYENRHEYVPDCIVLTPDNIESLYWMPHSCAYRRLLEGRGLPDWHPLITGTTQTVITSGNSVAGKVFSQDKIALCDMVDHFVDWD